YKDSNKEDNKFGDFIIWKEIINYSKKFKTPIIFITEDNKEDWWCKVHGETIGPRNELIKEFNDETGEKIYIYKLNRFIEFASKTLKIDENKRALKEIIKLRKLTKKEEEKINIIDRKRSYLQREEEHYRRKLEILNERHKLLNEKISEKLNYLRTENILDEELINSIRKELDYLKTKIIEIENEKEEVKRTIIKNKHEYSNLMKNINNIAIEDIDF
ncbi:MAG: PIN-like domain-containing protein, partial [Bacillota bacterium]|nr:PIN-like domain-containing protein [Bacillota bacterium]